MDAFNQTFLGAISFLCCGALSVVILHRGIKEGVVIKTGLILMMFSCFATGALTFGGLHSAVGVWHANVMLRAGILIVIAGYAWKVKYGRDRRIVSRNWRC